MRKPEFWIGVASLDHVDRAVAGTYVELNRGRACPLERMHSGDGFAWYSPRIASATGASLQAFTALGRIANSAIYQIDAGGDARPFRRAIDYLAAQPVPIKPLLDTLSFIRSKSHWGAVFRFGFLRVPAADFAIIAAAMGRTLTEDFPLPP